jgi:hypothetical protein
MPLALADVRASVHACKGEQKVRSAIVKQIFSAVQEHCPPENHSPFATRYLPFAAVLALTGGSCSRTTENEFGCSGEQPSSLIPTRPKFFGTAEPCSPEKTKTICYSPLAIRYSLPFYQSLIASRHSPSFRLGRSLALPFLGSYWLSTSLSFTATRLAFHSFRGLISRFIVPTKFAMPRGSFLRSLQQFGRSLVGRHREGNFGHVRAQ